MSSRIAGHLGLSCEHLEKPMTIQLPVTGWRTIVNHRAVEEIHFQGVRDRRRFDIMNLDRYGLNLGNSFPVPTQDVVTTQGCCGSDTGIEGKQVAVIPSRAAEVAGTYVT